MSSVKLVNITKSFDEKIVLQDINIDIKDGELVSLLGVSGCGKSTTLQLIAGLINPDSGDIIFNDKSVLNTPTGKRDAVIVFQDYLLFPHMSVYENIEFGNYKFFYFLSPYILKNLHDFDLKFTDNIIMKLHEFINKVSITDSSAFGLDTSVVIDEKVPLHHKNASSSLSLCI